MDYELIKPDQDDKYDPAPFFSYARLRSTELAERDPDVGDTVHFWDGYGCRAAVVGCLNEELGEEPSVDLAVLMLDMDQGLRWQQEPRVQHAEGRDAASWHWPCGGR